MDDMTGRINDYLAETTRLLEGLDRAAIAGAAEMLLACHGRQGRVWTIGHGGPAAQHFACDPARYVIPAESTPQTEGAQRVIEHLSTDLLRRRLAGKDAG